LFDEMVEAEALLERALAVANESVALPGWAFTASKRQLRGQACRDIEAAMEGAEPMLDAWLPKETAQAAARVLAGKG
jgi:enoyl-CoA hydratase/carnithine racemase